MRAPVAESHRRSAWSPPLAVAASLPSGEYATAVTSAWWPSRAMAPAGSLSFAFDGASFVDCACRNGDKLKTNTARASGRDMGTPDERSRGRHVRLVRVVES